MNLPPCDHCDRPADCELARRGTRSACRYFDPEHPDHDPAIGRAIRDRFEGVTKYETAQRPTPPRAFPPLLQQAASYATSTVRHVAAGRPRTDDATLVARLAVCGGCDHLKDGRCLACGCGVKDKAVRALEACPLDRWPISEEQA